MLHTQYLFDLFDMLNFHIFCCVLGIYFLIKESHTSFLIQIKIIKF